MRHNLSIFLLAFAATANAEHWNQFGGAKRDFQLAHAVELGKQAPTKRWQTTLGDGMSQVVLDENTCYTCFLLPFSETELKLPEHKRNHREVVIALDRDNGKVRWRYEYESGWYENQQAFGGRVRAPQATPAIMGDRIITIGFTGLMHCLDRKTGEVIWKSDLAKQCDATPVQFGFAASPILMEDRVIVLAGGQDGGLLCLNAASGEQLWNVPCNEASYATPVVWRRSDGNQIVFVTRNRVVGVSAADGSPRWEYRLPGKGLTNVPTPLLVDETDVIVSGQGVKGTRRLHIERKGEDYEVSERWNSGTQFFYCNWLLRKGKLIGCDGSLLVSLDVETGKLLARHRGFKDANIIAAEDGLVVLYGEGDMSFMEFNGSIGKVVGQYSVLSARCWTPPTIASNRVWCRGDDQILCLDLIGGDPRAAVVATRIRKQELRFDSSAGTSKTNKETVNPIQQILTASENSPDEAWKVYNQIRDDDPDSLSFDQRTELITLANDAGLHDFARVIGQHATEDFPEETQQQPEPSKEVTRSDNGLLYVEFGIKNTGSEVIQAFVKGPPKHPFSYGLPIRPGKVRLEKWPVGTKLHQTVNGITRGELLTVTEQDAGKIKEVSAQ